MKLKKTISLLAAVLITASMFTACGGKESKDSDSSSAKDSVTESSSEEETSEESEEETSEEETTEETTTEEVTTEKAADSKNPSAGGSASDFGDITISMDGSESTEEAPVKLGEWATHGIFAAQDETYHNVACRFTKVTRESDDKKYIDDAIALNNDLCSSFGKIDVSKLKVPSDCELCVAEYEVYIPSDFPSAEWGVTSPSISVSIENTDGAGFPSADGASTYIGLSSTTSLSTTKESKYQTGNTYTFKCLFIMVKGYEKFAFKISGYPEGTTDVKTGERYEAFYASK